MNYTFKGNFGTLELVVDDNGNASGTYQEGGTLEIRGFVEALLEPYSGDEDEVLYKMPWAEKYLIEIKLHKTYS